MRQLSQFEAGSVRAAAPPRMGRTARRAGLPLVLGVLCLAASGIANASCAGFLKASEAGHDGRMMPAVFHPDEESGGFLRAGALVPWSSPIVGLWKVEFLARGNSNGIPDGALIDFGTAIWHEDGTEEMVSGGRAPSTGDVCMGVWEQTGHSSYKLTHVALAWGGTSYLGPATIIENITLDPSGNGFHGSFVITQYAAAAAPGAEFDESSVVPPTPIYGVITGKRVSID